MKYAVARLAPSANRGWEWTMLPRIYASEFEAAQRAKKDDRAIVVPLSWADNEPWQQPRNEHEGKATK